MLIAQDKHACMLRFWLKGLVCIAWPSVLTLATTVIYRVREFSAAADPDINLRKMLWKSEDVSHLAGIFTEALPRAAFQQHRRTRCGMRVDDPTLVSTLGQKT